MLVVAAANLKKREEKGTSVVAATHLPERVVLLANQVCDVPGGMVFVKAMSQTLTWWTGPGQHGARCGLVQGFQLSPLLALSEPKYLEQLCVFWVTSDDSYA